jgi:hypothetical protein
MKQKKLTRSQFDVKMRAEVERLIAEDRMLPLDIVLAAVEETRKKYHQRILDARKPLRPISVVTRCGTPANKRLLAIELFGEQNPVDTRHLSRCV